MKVVWSRFALDELHSIHRYYKMHVSSQMADSIRDSVFSAAGQLVAECRSGKVVEELSSTGLEFRSLLRGYYRIIYLIKDSQIHITDVFDTRLNPNRMNRNFNRGV